MRRRGPQTVRGRLALVAVVIAALAAVSSLLVITSLHRASVANRELTEHLIPARLDAIQLDRLYRDLAVVVASGGATPETVAQTWDTAADLRSTIRPLAGDHTKVAARFAIVEAAADAWETALNDPAVEALEPYALLRDELNDLARLLDELVAGQQDDVQDATLLARAVSITMAVLVFGTGAGVVLAVRRWVTVPLDQLVHQASAVASGELTTPIRPSGPSDLVAVGDAVEGMRRQLLADASRRVDSALIAGHQAESARIAGDLHDDQVQAMTLVSIRLQQLRRRLGDEPDSLELVAAAEAATNDAIARLRRMIFELHSPVLERDGLTTAIEVYLDETFGDDVAWSVHGDAGELDDADAGLAYRLAREAMFNAFKHAEATRLDVVLDRSEGQLTISVVDDGVGFEPHPDTPEPGHLGADHARQLAAAAGGTWTVSSRPGHGTTVRCSLPVDDAALPPGVDPAAGRHSPR